jgi:signal transduction histidine kinase
MKKSLSSINKYLILIIAILIITIILFGLFMKPSPNDLLDLTIYLSFTSLVSAIVGYFLYRFGWWRKFPGLSYILLFGNILAGGLTLLNVWVTARLMFINQHDLILGSLLLIFAGGISIAFGFFISSTITQDLKNLVDGANQLSKGKLSSRVPVNGKDEIAQLSTAFNEMATQLELANKNERALDEARRNLVAWASHDLRTPLTSLRAMIAALVDRVVDDPETVSRYLIQSQNEIERMSNLLNDLFELAQLDAGYQNLSFEWIAISDLISDTLGSFTASAKIRSINLSGNVDKNVDLVWAAPEKISRILDNLVSNAISFTPEGGEVVLNAVYKENATLVSVKNTGNNISANDLPHIFDRFYRGDKSRTRVDNEIGGVGLGLAIAKGLVQAHGGKIGVESEKGKHTIFWFSLPKNNKQNK